MEEEMKYFRPLVGWLALLIGLAAWCAAAPVAQADDTTTTPPPALTPTPEALTPAQLISLINRVRTGNGLRALIVDPILMGTAQSTADAMAIYHMTGHIGDVRGRVMAAGYGVGDIPWATENFIVLPLEADPGQQILLAWSDDLHMKPMADPNYVHVGAGVAISDDGSVYYVLQAAYTSNRIYKPGATPKPGAPTVQSISQYIYAVRVATPRPDGTIVHLVRAGQSLWSIAIAYGVHIEDVQRMNGYSQEYFTIFEGQKLRIPTRAPTMTPFPTRTLPPATATGTPSDTPGVIGPSATATQPALVSAEEAVTIQNSIPSILIGLALLGVALIVFGILFKD
jgi:uncharacterized protein YkwD